MIFPDWAFIKIRNFVCFNTPVAKHRDFWLYHYTCKIFNTPYPFKSNTQTFFNTNFRKIFTDFCSGLYKNVQMFAGWHYRECAREKNIDFQGASRPLEDFGFEGLCLLDGHGLSYLKMILQPFWGIWWVRGDD